MKRKRKNGSSTSVGDAANGSAKRRSGKHRRELVLVGNAPPNGQSDESCPHGVPLDTDENCRICEVRHARSTEGGKQLLEACQKLSRKELIDRSLMALADSAMVDMHAAVGRVDECLFFGASLRRMHEEYLSGELSETISMGGSELPQVSERKMRRGAELARVAGLAISRLEDATQCCIKALLRGQEAVGVEMVEALLDEHPQVSKHLRDWSTRTMFEKTAEVAGACFDVESALDEAERNGAGSVALKAILNRFYGRIAADRRPS